MENGVSGRFYRFIRTAPLAMIIVGLVVTWGSLMSPPGSSLPGAHTNGSAARVAESDSRGTVLRAEARPNSLSVVPAHHGTFFTQLASFLTCTRGWWAILARLLGYGDTPLTSLAATVDTCDPGSGLEALTKVLRF